jgi:hypothetical protein
MRYTSDDYTKSYCMANASTVLLRVERPPMELKLASVKRAFNKNRFVAISEELPSEINVPISLRDTRQEVELVIL